jgi:hypothetical protein
MKRYHSSRRCWSLSGVLVGTLLFAASASAEPPSIEGTYELISRKLADGTMLSPPDVMGLWTYTKSHRNYNSAQKDVTGKFRSRSMVSTYKLTASEYTETLVFSIVNNQIAGKEPVSDFSGQTRSAPVTVEGTRIRFKMPFESPLLVFEENKITATTGEGLVDVWERVQ